MRICIVGAGLSGSILYHNLVGGGFKIDIYDPSLTRGCRGSGYIIGNKREINAIKKVLKTMGLSIKDYIGEEINTIKICGEECDLVKEAYMINKPKLIEDLAP